MSNTTGKTPISISTGSNYTIVLMNDNTVYGCGYNGNATNEYSLLADGSTTTRLTLTSMNIPAGKTPISVSCSAWTMVLMSNDSVYGTGYNRQGQLGDGTITHRFTLSQMINTTGKKIISIYANCIHTIILMSDGSLYACGDGTFGALGNGTTSNTSTLVQMTVGDGITPIKL
jgi:hypothetical protein